MEERKRNRLVRLLEHVERWPFQHGEAMYVKMDNDHSPITNKGEQDLPHSQVPETVQADAIYRERRRRDTKN